MLNKSIYSNPYLFIVLMDQHSSYFETYEDSSPHEGLYRIVKKFNSEKQTGDPLDVFGEYKIHGKEEFVRALTEMDPDYNKGRISLKKINCSVLMSSTQTQGGSYPWSVSVRIGEKTYKLKFFVNIRVDFQFDNEVFSGDVNLEEMGMAGKVACSSFLQKLLQNVLQKDGNEKLLEKFNDYFRFSFVPFERQILLNFPPYFLYNLVLENGYRKLVLIKNIFNRGANEMYWSYQLEDEEKQIFSFNLCFLYTYIFSEEVSGFQEGVVCFLKILFQNDSILYFEVNDEFKKSLDDTRYTFLDQEIKSFLDLKKRLEEMFMLKSTALPIPLDARKGAFEMALDLLSDLVVAK